jgi:hypothetical protein
MSIMSLSLTKIFLLIRTLAQYGIILLMVLYTLEAYQVLRLNSSERKERLFLRQNFLTLLIHALAFLSMFLDSLNLELLFFYAAQVIYLLFVLVLFRNLYPMASRSLINNMVLLLTVGFIMVTRLSYDQAFTVSFKVTRAFFGPGTEPLTRSRFSAASTRTTSRFCTVMVRLPM